METPTRSVNRRVAVISLGCPKNLVDSESMVSQFLSQGLEMVQDPAQADLVLVNTCGFLGSARQESLDAIREVTRLKTEGGVRAVFVAGCMVGNYEELIRREVPDVDRLLSFSEYEHLGRIVDEHLPAAGAPSGFTIPGRHVQARLTPAHFAYLKISEGCNHTCSFCVIPSIRGRMKSVPLDELVERAKRLVSYGAKEINLIAQDSTMYGVDLYGEFRLVDLLDRLSTIENLRWLRLLYAYPTEVSDALIDRLADASMPVLPYIDVPLQHASARMLRLMNRKTDASDVETLLERLRAKSPEITVRTTMIVGFPGETEDDFAELLEFVARHRFDRLGAFAWSPEEGSAAWSLGDRVDEDVKQERLARLMALQEKISLEKHRALMDTEIDVLVDGPLDDGTGVQGRSPRDAPEVDGSVTVRGPSAAPGEIVRARIRAAGAHDLEADRI